MATKAKPTNTEPAAPPADQAEGQQDQQQGSAEGAQASETQAPATAGAADGQGAGAETQQDPAPQEVQLVDVRVLAAVTIGGERFQPDDVIEGMPGSVADAYAGSVDSHPEAVAYACSIGAPVKPYPGLAHAED